MEIEGWVMTFSGHKYGWVMKILRIYWGGGQTKSAVKYIYIIISSAK